MYIWQLLKLTAAKKQGVWVKMTSRRMVISLLLPLIAFLPGCKIVDQSTQYRLQSIPSDAKEEIAVAAFQEKHDLDGDPNDGLQVFLGVFTLGVSSWFYPPHSNFAAFCPELPSRFESRISCHLDAELLNGFQPLLGTQIVWSNEVTDGKTSIKELASVAKRHGKKYLYVVVYNEYNFVGRTTGVSSSGDKMTIAYDSLRGSIPMASRILIDLTNDKPILMNERLGEQDWYLFLGLGVWRIRDGESDAQFDYAKQVASQEDESLAKVRLADYLRKEDLEQQPEKNEKRVSR